MTVRVELPDGTAWEHEDSTPTVSFAGALILARASHLGDNPPLLAVYAPGAWSYAERVS